MLNLDIRDIRRAYNAQETTMPIDYERAKKNGPKIKAALTRAMNITDPLKRKDAVIFACRRAVAEWNLWGAWPDNWSHWERALSDAQFMAQRTGVYPPTAFLYLEDFE